MQPLILTLAVVLSLVLSPWTIAAQAAAGKETVAKSSPMPEERAKALLADARFQTFIAVAEKDFGGKCAVPGYNAMEAKLIQKGSGDFSSSFYEVSIACTGNNGLAELQITAEFSPPLGEPLNLLLSLYFKR